mmetsp:Transcript_10953/g.23932  ORF Transcript_10953/g.23932 Transcript_10953/m.23932 type:complete len:212 (-) Transcript_10953:1612-2247(-)
MIAVGTARPAIRKSRNSTGYLRYRNCRDYAEGQAQEEAASLGQDRVALTGRTPRTEVSSRRVQLLRYRNCQDCPESQEAASLGQERVSSRRLQLLRYRNCQDCPESQEAASLGQEQVALTGRTPRTEVSSRRVQLLQEPPSRDARSSFPEPHWLPQGPCPFWPGQSRWDPDQHSHGQGRRWNDIPENPHCQTTNLILHFGSLRSSRSLTHH